MSNHQPPLPPPVIEGNKPISITITLPTGLEARNSVLRGFLQIPAQLGIMMSVFMPAYSYGSYGLDSSTSFWELSQNADKPILAAPLWLTLVLVGIVIIRMRAEILRIRQDEKTVRFMQAIQLMAATFVTAHSLVFWGSFSGTTNPMGSSVNIGAGVFMAVFFSVINSGLVLWDFMGDSLNKSVPSVP